MTLNDNMDSGAFPMLFTFVSLPYRTDSPGFSDDHTRYIVKTEGVQLELFSAASNFQIPTGKTGRNVLAYLSSKIIRKQFYNLVNKNVIKLKEKGFKNINININDEIDRLIYNIEDIKFVLPNITDLTVALFNYKSSKNVKKCYDYVNSVFRMGISATVSTRLENLKIPNKQFVISKELYFNLRNKKDKNYVILTTDGIKFILNSIPIPYEDYITLDAVEQDLLTILLRKTHNPRLIDKMKTARMKLHSLGDRLYEDGEKILAEARQEIEYAWLVKQIFNIDTTNHNYPRYKEKIINALNNLMKRYEKREFGTSIQFGASNTNFCIYGTDNLLGFNN